MIMVGPDAEEETACRIRISNKYNLKPLYLVTLKYQQKNFVKINKKKIMLP